MTTRVSLAIAVILVSGCGDKEADGPPAEPNLVPLTVQSIFTTNCAKSGCHAGSSPQQGMNLSENTAYGAIVNITSNEKSTVKRIKPGDPDNSYLVQKIEGAVTITGDRMPKDQGASGPGGYLTQTDIDSVRAWVTAGALPR